MDRRREVEVRFAWEWRGMDWKDFERVERKIKILFFFRERKRTSWGRDIE